MLRCFQRITGDGGRATSLLRQELTAVQGDCLLDIIIIIIIFIIVIIFIIIIFIIRIIIVIIIIIITTTTITNSTNRWRGH